MANLSEAAAASAPAPRAGMARWKKWAIGLLAAPFIGVGLLTGLIFAVMESSEDFDARIAQQAVRDMARDPDSLVFRNIFTMRVPGEPRRICGEVNARNGYGGYGGFRLFIVDPQTPANGGNVAVIENPDRTNRDFIARACRPS